MRVRDIETPELTGKTWDNELFRLTDHVRGDCHHEIMNNINVGDVYFDGVGTKHICVTAMKVDARWQKLITNDNQEIGNNWRVEVQPTKKDGTVNRAVATVIYVHRLGWESEKI